MDFSVFNLRISVVCSCWSRTSLASSSATESCIMNEGERTTGKLTGGGGEADREPGRYSAELDSYGNDHVIDARNFPSEIHRAEFHTVQNSFRVRQMAVPVAQSENWHLLFLKKKKERINATLQSPIGRPARLEGIARPSTPNSSGHPAPAQRLRFS